MGIDESGLQAKKPHYAMRPRQIVELDDNEGVGWNTRHSPPYIQPRLIIPGTIAHGWYGSWSHPIKNTGWLFAGYILDAPPAGQDPEGHILADAMVVIAGRDKNHNGQIDSHEEAYPVSECMFLPGANRPPAVQYGNEWYVENQNWEDSYIGDLNDQFEEHARLIDYVFRIKTKKLKVMVGWNVLSNEGLTYGPARPQRYPIWNPNRRGAGP